MNQRSHSRRKADIDPAPEAIAASSRDESATSVLRALRLIFRSVQRHNHWIEQQCGIGGAQLWALCEISETADLRVSDLAKRLSIHQSTASNLIDKLVDQGFAVRERNGADQRVVYIRLTEAGRGVVGEAPRPSKNLIVDALHGVSDETLQQLDDNLKELVQQLKVRDPNAAMQPLYDL
jgi:DNA-binding MarR family transcriptional regulator